MPRSASHWLTIVGVAVALEDGLITLTIPDADVQPLSRIAGLSAGGYGAVDGRALVKGPSREQMTAWVAEAFRECAAYGELPDLGDVPDDGHRLGPRAGHDRPRALHQREPADRHQRGNVHHALVAKVAQVTDRRAVPPPRLPARWS